MVQHQCRSIAFCCVSTGIFGFPNLEAAVCALQTVRQWLDEDESHRQAVDCILFCVFLDKDKDIYERHMPLFFPLTPEELEGKTTDEAERVEDGTEGGAVVKGEGKDGSESKRQKSDQPDGKQSGNGMEVNRGDTVWVRADNSTANQPTQQTSSDETAADADQPQSTQDDGKSNRYLAILSTPLHQLRSLIYSLRF